MKQLLAGPAQAAAVLQTLLPPEIAGAVDGSSLPPATRELPAKGRASTHTDLVYRAGLAGGARPVEVFLYVSIEHQSTPDPTMPIRVLAGLTGLWRSWQRNPAGKPLPLVIPLVLAHTEQGWKAPRSMDELLAIPRMHAPMLARDLPRFDLLLVDLSEAERDQLARWARAVEARGARAQAIMLRTLVVVRDAEALARRPAGGAVVVRASCLQAARQRALSPTHAGPRRRTVQGAWYRRALRPASTRSSRRARRRSAYEVSAGVRDRFNLSRSDRYDSMVELNARIGMMPHHVAGFGTR